MQEPLEKFKKEMTQKPNPSFEPGFSGRVMEAIAGLEAPRFEIPDFAGALWRAFRPLSLASAAACLLLFLFHAYRPVDPVGQVDGVGPVAGARVENSREEVVTFEDWWVEVSNEIYGGLL